MSVNALSPDRMTAAERLDEVAEILAAGVVRLIARTASPLSADRSDRSLNIRGARA